MMFVSNKIHEMKKIGAETFNNGEMDYRHPVEYDDDDTGLSSGWRFINRSFVSKTMASPPRIREKDLENSTPEEHAVKENRECVMLEDELSLNYEKISQDVANIVEVDIFGGITENGDVVCNIEALLAKYERQHPNLYSNRPTSAETPLFVAGAIISKKKKSVHFALEDQVNVADRYIGHIGKGIDRDNVFVRVEKEYKKKKPGEISLKKGMKFKQKRAPTCDGMSYGWAKKYVFSPKKYGFFRFITFPLFEQSLCVK